MKLETIKEAVDQKFNLDIATNSRQRNFTDAKKIFSKLGYESGATFRAVGEAIGRSHCNVLHHVNSGILITGKGLDIHTKRFIGSVLSFN